MPEELVQITHFTDPACPFAFSAEPDLLALRWFYGDQISIDTRLVVLSEEPGEYEGKGFTPEMLQRGAIMLADKYGMPIFRGVSEHMLIAKPGDLAIKAVELNDPDRAEAFTRAMRVAWQTYRQKIDERDEILAVAGEAGVDTDALPGWIDDPATHEALEADKRAARSPETAATGPLDHKLGGPPEERRYTCPSLVFNATGNPDTKIVAPGMQNLNVYDVVIANLAPSIVRAKPADDPLEVLRWAPYPLAAVEVSRVMDTELDAAATALEDAGAVEVDGYWSLRDEDQLAAGAAPADRFVGSAGVS